MKTLTFKGYGIFDCVNKIELLRIEKTLRQARKWLKKNYPTLGNKFTFIYKIEILRDEKPISNIP